MLLDITILGSVRTVLLGSVGAPWHWDLSYSSLTLGARFVVSRVRWIDTGRDVPARGPCAGFFGRGWRGLVLLLLRLRDSRGIN